MSRDDVMALANKTAGQNWMDEAHIQRFAALVAAAEREACAKVCDEMHRNPSAEPDECAAAIRARGQGCSQQAESTSTLP